MKGEAIQHKRVWGKNPTTASATLREAGRQLRGQGGEQPPSGFMRTIDLRIDPDSGNPLRHADRTALEVWIRQTTAGEYAEALKDVGRLKINNARGTFLFEAPFKKVE